MDAEELDRLDDDELELVRWSMGRQAAVLRTAGDLEVADRLVAWGMLAEAELTRRGTLPVTCGNPLEAA